MADGTDGREADGGGTGREAAAGGAPEEEATTSYGNGMDVDLCHTALAAHAGRCALALAQLKPPRPPGMAEEMALHTALACGTVAAMHVGGVHQKYEFLITGHQVRARGRRS